MSAISAGGASGDVLLGLPPADGSGPGSTRFRLAVHRVPRPIGAAALGRLVDAGRAADQGIDGLLLIAPRASSAVRRRAAELGVGLIALNAERATGPDGFLVMPDGRSLHLGTPPARVEVTAGAGRTAEAWFLVVRVLLLGEVMTQQQLAGRLQVSQARVSQVLSELVRAGLLHRGRPSVATQAPATRTWRIVDRARLLDHWLDRYPGPGGVTTYWYGLAPVAQQAVEAVEALRGNASGDEQTVLVSGQVAADLVAPWSRPQQALVYARIGADLTGTGLTPCPPEDATLALTVPADRGVWAFPDWYGSRPGAPTAALPLADPLQVLADLGRSPGPDADQSSDHVRRWLIDQLEEAG